MSLRFRPIPYTANERDINRWREALRQWFATVNSRTSVSDADYTTSRDYRIAVTSLTAPRTITVSSADIALKDRFINEFVFNDESGGAAANNITIATEGSETINGAATATISTNYGSLRLYSDGNNLYTTE